MCWQPFMGRNPWQVLLEKSNLDQATALCTGDVVLSPGSAGSEDGDTSTPRDELADVECGPGRSLLNKPIKTLKAVKVQSSICEVKKHMPG